MTPRLLGPAEHAARLGPPARRVPAAMSKARLESGIRRDGFAFVAAPDMRRWLTRSRPDALVDWTRFADSWQDLRRDEYMADGGRDRFRRHAVLTTRTNELPRLEPRQPHYQD